MATATGKTRCIKCEKEKTTSKCSGCLEDFCFDHLVEHRQELSKQLDELENNRNLFLQTLTEQTTNPQKHSLIQQINQWENDSIHKIRQTAEQTRELLLKYTIQHIQKIETNLTKLTEEIKEIREENDFNEINLNKFKGKLKRLEEELLRPPNISIEQDSLAFINKISVIVFSLQLNIPINAKWIQNGNTVAGGNGKGGGLNQLSKSFGFYVDDDQTIYVADYNNHRIVEWKKGATSGHVVAGGNGQGDRNDQLNNPVYVIIDKENDSFIISDQGNGRVVRWPRRNGTRGEPIISNVSCCGLAMHNNGYLYVSDGNKHEVRRWKIGETTGTLVAGGNGKGNRLDQLSTPFYIFIDEHHSVYVSDCNNHRVMKWMKGAKEGIVVAGGHGPGNSLTQLPNPFGIIVDQLGTIYIADFGNNRVVRWLKGAREGSVIVDRNGLEARPNQLLFPLDLSFDEQNNLYVVDYGNPWIQKFDIEWDSNK